MAGNKHYGDVANLLVSSVIALWVIDVLVHLHLVEKILLP